MMDTGNQVKPVKMPDQPIPWHAIPDDKVFKKLQTSLNGLDSNQVKERQREFGLNILPEHKPPTIFQIILHQFKSPLIYILLAAGAIALFTGDVKDAIFILAVIVLNAAIGAAQEWRAEQSAHALQQMLKIQAKVRRDGQQYLIDARN